MKNIFGLLLLLSMGMFVQGQTFTKAEYFFDSDPGINKGTALTVSGNTDAVSFAASIPTGSLGPGFHFLGLRVQQSNGLWSHYERRMFYIAAPLSSEPDAPPIVAAEYFFNADPGAGSGTPLTVSPSGNMVSFTSAIPLGNLSTGFNFIGIRTRDANGRWGMYERRMFYVSPAITAQPDMPAITGAEYFIDSDPGAGKGTAVAIGGSGNTVNFTAAILANLSTGFHFLGLRTRDADGRWGMYERRMFYVSPAIAAQPDMPAITGAEYFIDSDPGAGKGTAVAIGGSGNMVSFTASIPADLSTGFHFMGLRTRDANGRWGMYERRMFYVSPAMATQPDMPAITAAEYFLDEDPGPGKGIPLAVNTPGFTINQLFNIPISRCIPQGKHRIAIRVRDADGRWGMFHQGEITISGFEDDIPCQTGDEPKITLGTINTLAYCVGATLQLPFTVSKAFDADNEFYAQLSDASGSFTNRVQVGSLVGTTSGTIQVTLPANTPAGTNYRLRIRSKNPATLSDTSVAITISVAASQPISISGLQAACLGEAAYQVHSPQPGTTYTWSVTGGNSLSPQTGTGTTVTWATGGAFVLTAIASNVCGQGASANLNINVTGGAPQLIPGITRNNRTLTASALSAGATGYQWYKDDGVISGATAQSYVVPDSETGIYKVAYTNACGVGATGEGLVVEKARTIQTITFTPVSAKTFGDDPFAVTATASSGLPISSYSIVSGPATLAGNTVTISGAGEVVIRATQEGNESFAPAENTLSINILRAAATITLSQLSYTYDGTPKQAVATTVPAGLNAQILYNGSTNLPISAGTYTVTAQITSQNYTGSTSGELIIARASQTLQLVNPGNKKYNDLPFIPQATSSAGLPVQFSISTNPASGVASIAGNVITLLGAGGTVTITANQPGNVNFLPAEPVTVSFAVQPPEAKDLEVVQLISPVNGCETTISSPLKIRVRNSGTEAVSSFGIGYRIENEAVVVENVSASIAPGVTADFTFTTPGIFAQVNKQYPVALFTRLEGDERPSNDTLKTAVVRFSAPAPALSADTAICAGGQATLRSIGAGSTQWTGGPASATYTVSPAATTTYQAVVTDINGCTQQTLNVTVTVNANPVVNAGADQTILRGSSATLEATGAPTIRWNMGANTASIVVAPESTTTYTATGTNAAGCTASDAVTVTVNFSAISVSPGFAQFGGVVVDSIRNQFITITNSGTLAETLTSITGFQAPFSTTFTTPVTIPAGATVQVPVRFAPKATLIYQNNLVVATSAGNFNIVIRGTGVNPAPSWMPEPPSYSFNKVQVGTFVTQNIRIRNTGNVAIQISTISSSNPRFVGSNSGVFTVPVGGFINLAVRFNPIAVTSYTGIISVRSTNASVPLLRVAVSGSGFLPGNPPELQFVQAAPFDGRGAVSPEVGQPGNYTYSVLYRSPDGTAPMAGFPKVGIDRSGDGDFVDNLEGLFTMEKATASTNWAEGVLYSFSTTLPVGDKYGYQFFATDVKGNEAELTQYKNGPVVTRQVLDLHIFASDITFSKPNPAVNEDFKVTAVINNNSPYSAAEVPVKFFYKDTLFLFEDTIPFIAGESTASLTHTLNFSPDGFYPIKVWIDSARTLGEGNILNNYASRPVIVGNFSVPGAIDLVSNAIPSGCARGRTTFSGRATYRGLNLDGTPPVLGARVIIRIPGFQGGRTIETTTDINGNWYVYDDPCKGSDDGCLGYECGVVYDYTVEVTDFTLTAPTFSGNFSRPCLPCTRLGNMTNFVGVNSCIKEGDPFTITTSVLNGSVDLGTGLIICGLPAYNDTITMYLNGQLMATYYVDSLTLQVRPCSGESWQFAAAGLPAGRHEVSMTHVYYYATGERREDVFTSSFEVIAHKPDLMLFGVFKTGHTSFAFLDANMDCSTPAGRHKVYLYDSLPGYKEYVLLDSFTVNSVPPGGEQAGVTLRYSNPLMIPGMHYLKIVTDVENVIDELKEDNNILKTQFYVQPPDITISRLTPSSGSTPAGGLINFSAELRNIGGPINQPFAVAFRANGVLVGSLINVPSMHPDETIQMVSAPFTVPASLCPVQVVAYADVNNVIVEENEKNNTDTTQFGINIVAGRTCDDTPDNTGSGFFDSEDPLATATCLPYFAGRGVLTYFTTYVRNWGSRDARNVKVRFTYRGEEIGTDVIPLLRPGQQYETGVWYAFDSEGRKTIEAFADYTREICETNETDNIGSIKIDVRRTVSDLEILSQYIAPSNLNPMPGQTITVVSSIINKGELPSTPNSIRFWVNDVQLGEDVRIDSLEAGQDTTVMATATYSSDIVGLKIIKAQADINNEVTEWTKRNNAATRSIIVGAAPDFSRSISEAITLQPATFGVGDQITIRNYIRNYGGEAGAAWLRFSYRNLAGEKIVIDSVRFVLESNDSMRISLPWIVAEPVGNIITEIVGSIPPEFNDLNNIDSLRFEAALPLTLLSFNGKVQQGFAWLQWQTTDEVDVSHFEVERSTNGVRFDVMGQLAANNRLGRQQYQFTDSGFALLPEGPVFYRLRMVDKDGQYRYSPVVKLNHDAPQMVVKAYPNPVKQNLLVDLQSVRGGRYQLRLVDLNGRTLLVQQHQVQHGRQTITVSMQQLPAGMYLLLIQDGDGVIKEVKVMKE